jgi:hypothetical protein
VRKTSEMFGVSRLVKRLNALRHILSGDAVDLAVIFGRAVQAHRRRRESGWNPERRHTVLIYRRARA